MTHWFRNGLPAEKLGILRVTQGVAAAILGALLITNSVFAGDREQAQRIHDRIAGVPPSVQVLDDMEAAIADGNRTQAAYETAAYMAMENSEFYRVTLKNLAVPWTNRDQDSFAPLNDYVATFIGVVRDEQLAFNEILAADVLYVGNDPRLPAYSPSSNAHYEEMERLNLDLGDQNVLSIASQSGMNGTPSEGIAGLLTTRAAAQAFFVAGTNRAMFRFTMLNHLCHDMEEVQDTSRVPDRIRQDVSRSPGGDSRVFLNGCIGCHSGMDPMAQAFAYHDYDEAAGRMIYTPGTVRPKYFNNNATFKYGFVTPNDEWDNYWREGPNRWIGWNFGPTSPGGSGTGAASLGRELGNSEAFARCQVKKVFKAVCLRDPADGTDITQIATMTNSFRASNYSLKQVFAESAVYCKGD